MIVADFRFIKIHIYINVYDVALERHRHRGGSALAQALLLYTLYYIPN